MINEMGELYFWPYCPERPGLLAGQPIGMYHCPYCGDMQLAGYEHLPWVYWGPTLPFTGFPSGWGVYLPKPRLHA